MNFINNKNLFNMFNYVLQIVSVLLSFIFIYKFISIYINNHIIQLYVNDRMINDIVIILAGTFLIINVIYILVKNSKLYKDSDIIIYVSSFILICISLLLRLCVNEYYFILEHHLAQSKIIDWNYLIVEVKKNWSPIEMDAILKSHPKDYASLSAQQINELIYSYKDPQLMQAQMYHYARMNFNNELAEKAKLLSQQLSQQRELELYKQSWSYSFSKFLPYLPLTLFIIQSIVAYIVPSHDVDELKKKVTDIEEQIEIQDTKLEDTIEMMTEHIKAIQKINKELNL